MNSTRMLLLVLGILLGNLLPTTARAQSPETIAQAASALYEGIQTETLPNGLRIYLKPIPGAKVVTTIVAYKVGSADEELDQTGLSHYLEHLMFKGTEKLMPGDIDRVTLRNGGMNNAYTSEDVTVYHFDFAADRLYAALEIEADRMRNLRIDAKHEFEQEKGAVISELDMNEDRPWDLELKTILPMLFSNGPYGHPIIGERAHVRGATAAIIKAHYDKWYHPGNASLIVCGEFDAAKALAKIKELFSPIPKAELPARKTATPSTRKEPARKEMVSKFDVPRMLMGFNTVKIGDPDFYALEVIQGILTGGKTGRIYKKLVEQEELATEVDTSNQAGRYPGWYAVQVELLKGKDRVKTENTVLAELKRLVDTPVEPAELKRVKRSLTAHTIFGRESVHGLADSIARGVSTNDLDYLKGYLSKVEAVTAQDIQNVAKKYFVPEQRVVVWSVPGDRPGKQAMGGSLAPRAVLAPRMRNAACMADEAFTLQKTKEVTLPNGLKLLLLENKRLPIFVAEAEVRNVQLLEPPNKAGVANLTGSMLDEGTKEHTGPQIAELIEDVGGSLDFNRAGGSVKVLSSDRALGLKLFFECLTKSAFPEDAFSRKQAQFLSVIDDSEKQPDSKAQRIFREMVYGKHPLGRSSMGTRATVQPLKPDDCKDFYSKVFVPSNTVVAVVGDFDADKVVEEIKGLTAEWKSGPFKKPDSQAVDKPDKFVERILTMGEAAQLHFYMGHPGIKRSNPDYYKLLVMDHVLGTGPGFTDRLSSRLRDREGLAYTVSANISGSAGDEQGLFTCYIGTSPGNLEKVKTMFLEELTRIRKEKPTDEEVEDAKKYLLGSLPFRLTTNDRVAGLLLSINRLGLGLNYLEDYRKAVEAVTPAEVQAVAQKHLDPEHMILVVAGAVDEKGKPLAKPK